MVSTMDADALATCTTRLSAVMILLWKWYMLLYSLEVNLNNLVYFNGKE